MIRFGDYYRFDLSDPDDCMNLIVMAGWTNEKIKETKDKKFGYVSIHIHKLQVPE